MAMHTYMYIHMSWSKVTYHIAMCAYHGAYMYMCMYIRIAHAGYMQAFKAQVIVSDGVS